MPSMEYTDSDDAQSINTSEEEKQPMMQQEWAPTKKRQTVNMKLIIFALVLVLSLTANIVFTSLWFLQSRDLDAVCGNHTSAVWSPVMQDVQIQYHPVRFNGSFIEKPIYFQDPSPEVDEAWSGLGIDCKPISFSSHGQAHLLTSQ